MAEAPRCHQEWSRRVLGADGGIGGVARRGPGRGCLKRAKVGQRMPWVGEQVWEGKREGGRVEVFGVGSERQSLAVDRVVDTGAQGHTRPRAVCALGTFSSGRQQAPQEAMLVGVCVERRGRTL